MENKLEKIINLKLNNFEIKVPVAKGDTPAADQGAKQQVNLADYPWDKCVADQTERYGDEETAKKVCGAIKAMYGSKDYEKEGFVIPTPEGGEDQNTFVSRCISEISGEYDQEQAIAICYSKWEQK